MIAEPAAPPEWKIRNLTLLADGIGGRVWLAERSGGRKAILKAASAAARADAARAADYLRWRDGHGAVRLLASKGDIHLLEYIDGKRLLDHLDEHGDKAASQIAADVVTRLHSPSETRAPASLTSLSDHFASLFTRADNDRVESRASPFSDYAAFAGSLLENQRSRRVLHGDIHHENIMCGDRGWLAIDPKGIVGDPAYDAANLFHNPVGSPERLSETRIGSLATIMSRALGCTTEEVLSWAVGYSGLSASWWLDDGNLDAAESTLAIGERIQAVLSQVSS